MGNGRQIVITGVSRGLGRAMVAGFAKRGHTVIGCARSSDLLQELAGRYQKPHQFDTVDVADEAAVREWVTRILKTCGPPDLLINNAAQINRNSVAWEVPANEFSALVDANVKGTFYVLRSFLPAMVERGRGVIVNLSSAWGRTTSPEVAPYCATKWAIEGLTRALAQELPAGMAAVSLSPGTVHTKMLESCFGPDAANCQSPDQWARRAVPYLLQLGAKDNGRPLTTPT
jgi:NAD(P)-dependent dehydrogenase (short-subunit alcohol dehydrogenase family)